MSAEITDLWAYPLRYGCTLASNDWVEWRFHEFLSSSFLAHAIYEGRRADIGTALILWSECYRTDPAGTLPDDDVQLAQMARFGNDVAGWRAVRPGVLQGWQRVHVENGDGREPRLGHPFIADIAQRSWARKSGRMQGREAARLAQLKFKVRRKLADIGRKKLADNEHVVLALARWLEAGGLNITAENVSAGLEEVAGVSSVVPLAPGEGERAAEVQRR